MSKVNRSTGIVRVFKMFIIIAHEPPTLYGVGLVFEPWLQVIEFSHSCITGWLEPELETLLLYMQ